MRFLKFQCNLFPTRICGKLCPLLPKKRGSLSFWVEADQRSQRCATDSDLLGCEKNYGSVWVRIEKISRDDHFPANSERFGLTKNSISPPSRTRRTAMARLGSTGRPCASVSG